MPHFVLLIVYVAVERGIRSPWGRVLRAIREDEMTAAASGKNIFAFKMQAFMLGAFIMGVGGALYAHYVRAITPDTFVPMFGTFLIWVMLIVGGSGNNKGAILGALVVWLIWDRTGALVSNSQDPRIFYVRNLLIGVLVVGVLLLRPKGILGEEKRVSVYAGKEKERPQRPKRRPSRRLPRRRMRATADVGAPLHRVAAEGAGASRYRRLVGLAPRPESVKEPQSFDIDHGPRSHSSGRVFALLERLYVLLGSVTASLLTVTIWPAGTSISR